jgi:ubiquinone/menaquinone biosynthesis C-methylase UbiE
MSTSPVAQPYSPALAFADEKPQRASAFVPGASGDGVPAYLQTHYWWAYIHPAGVRLFERQWLVNLILWGNYAQLRDAALSELGESLPGRTLQVACVYGDLTGRLARRAAAAGGTLDVVDVLPIQLRNLRDKLDAGTQGRLMAMDSTRLQLPDGCYDRVLVFFLLHEQPAGVRRQTLREAFRVVKPGGKMVIVDYARPRWWNPLRYLWRPVLAALEPFALDLWRDDISAWMPASWGGEAASRRFFGGLYQMVAASVPPQGVQGRVAAVRDSNAVADLAHPIEPTSAGGRTDPRTRSRAQPRS